MESGQEQIVEQLMKDLSGYGFKGRQLRADIEQEVILGMPQFKVAYEQRFGQDLMSFTLPFEWDVLTNRYQFKQVHAVHRDPVDIEARRIDGIDIASLDKEMAGIDWRAWYSDGLDSDSKERSGNILKTLTRLYHSPDPDGKNTQQLLMYKHFPEPLFNLYRKTDGPRWENAYEHAYIFVLQQWPQFGPELAYLVMSEQMDYLADRVTGILQGLFPGIDPKDSLYSKLRSFPDRCEISGWDNMPEGFMEYTIPIFLKDGKYGLDDYSVTYTPYPFLTHGNINGIPTDRLEAMMQEIDWKNDQELFTFYRDREPDFTPEVAMIWSQIQELSGQAEGKQIADILCLKYLHGVTFFDEEIPASAWELLEGLPKAEGVFNKIDIRKARNLLKGKAVQYPEGGRDILSGRDWVRIDPGKKERDGTVAYQYITGPNRKDIENMLSMLLVGNPYQPGRVDMLLDGEKITVQNRLGKTLQLEVDAEKNSLRVFNAEGEAIPFNFQLSTKFGDRQLNQANIVHHRKRNGPGTGLG